MWQVLTLVATAWLAVGLVVFVLRFDRRRLRPGPGLGGDGVGGDVLGGLLVVAALWPLYLRRR